MNRGFLELERVHALQRLGRNSETDAARARTDALAAAFANDGLSDGCRGRVERQRQLTPA